MNQKELIICLIKDHLTNTRLVSGLIKLGLEPYHYDLHLGTTIFKLIGIKDEDDSLFEEYLKLCEQVTQMNVFEYPELLDSYAQLIYKRLITESNKLRSF